ncbi:hypothetical protein F3Y22_tig00020348pilonHSYRG00008 [Hibiscus syriacus]|uniref:SWIM-type domain-containing protein n=1 Tax=Hibiscus syriacus TaxID=106335 RepID=A0A6A3BTX6_HIBSY|nr:hypothetical protein F3Y22_tig00020348pilonHSYRG00008 [Hibiscus syriacus]
MEKRFLRSKGMASMKYGRESEYFIIVMHHGGFMVNSSGFKYTGNEGLVEAMIHVLPNAEHMTCVRHLYSNFKNNAQFKGKNLKDALWKVARATYKKEFKDAMDELKALSKPEFDCHKMILEARYKSILTLMEMIKTKIMENIAKKKEVVNKYTGSLCPRIQKKIELAIQQSTRCWPTYTGGQKYQVSAGLSNQHAIDIENHSCSCRKWDLTGIPCIHDVSVMVLNNQRPEVYVHNSYFVTTQREIYSHFIQPMRGPNQWLTDTTCEPVIPPTIRRPPGRPKKERRKETYEPTNSHATMSKKGIMMYCSKCGQPVHNQRTCKGIVGGYEKNYNKDYTIIKGYNITSTIITNCNITNTIIITS